MSYAVFTYQCGSLNWINHGASIGYSFNENFFENHYLSGNITVNDIACLNEPLTEWSNVVYNLGESICKSFINITYIIDVSLSESTKKMNIVCFFFCDEDPWFDSHSVISFL